MKKINRRVSTLILALTDCQETTVNTVEDMKEIVQKYYSDLFTPETSEVNSQNTFLDSVHSRLNAEESLALEEDYTKDEIADVIRDIKGSTCPGADGLSIELYKKFTKNLSKILSFTFRFLISSNSIPAEFTKGIVALIFKKGDATRLKNYWPITLLNTDYKILTKSIALQLKKICSKLVGPAQFAFLPNRQVSDNVMAAQLAIVAQKKKNEGRFIISLDNEKAYNKTLHS